MSSALINITYKTLYLQQTSKIGCFNHPSDGNNHFHLFPFQGPLIFCLLVCFYRSIHFVKGPIKTEHDNTGVFVRSFDVTSLYTNIPIIDTLNIIKDYVHSDDQFARKTAIPQDKFLDLVNLVLTTTWYTFNSQFYQQTDGVAMGGPASSTTAEIYMQAHESTAISTALHPPKVWERFADDVYSIVKRTQLENFFHHINNLHQNIKFTMEEESNGELAFLDTLLKRNNGEISVNLCWYIGSLHILTNTYTTALTTKQVVRKVLFPPCLIEHIPLSQIKMTYIKKTLG